MMILPKLKHTHKKKGTGFSHLNPSDHALLPERISNVVYRAILAGCPVAIYVRPPQPRGDR